MKKYLYPILVIFTLLGTAMGLSAYNNSDEKEKDEEKDKNKGADVE